MGLWMRQVICSFSQRRVVTIRQIDDGTIAGQFSLVDWQQLDAIAAGVEQLLRDLGLVDAGCVEVGQVLRGVPGTSAMVPTDVIWGDAAISGETSLMIDSALEKFAEALKPRAPVGQGDLYPVAEPLADFTEDRLQEIDRAGAECARALGKSIRHSVTLENADEKVVAIAQGPLRPPASGAVGDESTCEVQAIVDALGFRDFSVRLFTEDGERIDGHYESHDDFGTLAGLLQVRHTQAFEIVTRTDDKGKLRTVVRLPSCGR